VDEIVPRRLALGHRESNDERHSTRDTARDFIRGEACAPAIVAKRLTARFGRFALLVELGLGTETSICFAGVEQAMDVGAMALEVRALVYDLFVPVQAEPLESLEDRAGARFGAARFIGVFDAKQELAAVMFDEQPVEERSASAADVEVASG